MTFLETRDGQHIWRELQFLIPAGAAIGIAHPDSLPLSAIVTDFAVF